MAKIRKAWLKDFALTDKGQSEICRLTLQAGDDLGDMYRTLEDINYHSENRILMPSIEKLEDFRKEMGCSNLKAFTGYSRSSD